MRKHLDNVVRCVLSLTRSQCRRQCLTLINALYPNMCHPHAFQYEQVLPAFCFMFVPVVNNIRLVGRHLFSQTNRLVNPQPSHSVFADIIHNPPFLEVHFHINIQHGSISAMSGCG
jgi:hypothetical protein